MKKYVIKSWLLGDQAHLHIKIQIKFSRGELSEKSTSYCDFVLLSNFLFNVFTLFCQCGYIKRLCMQIKCFLVEIFHFEGINVNCLP